MTTPTAGPLPSSHSRKVFLAAAVAAGLLTLSACDGSELNVSWDVDTIDGSGTLTTETYNVADFDEIEVCCELDVKIVIEDSSDRSVEITIDDNLHRHLDIQVNDGDLEITPDEDIKLDTTGQVLVRISGYEISGLGVDTASTLSGDFPATDSFVVRADTAADVNITVDTERLSIRADTAADVNIAGVATMVDVNAGTGADVHLRGVDGIVDASVNVNTAALVEIEASGAVRGSASTSADINVWGNPTVDVDTDTDGKVHQQD